MVGPEEHVRLLRQVDAPKDLEMKGLQNAMEKSWQELKAGKPAPPMGQVNLKDTNIVGGK